MEERWKRKENGDCWRWRDDRGFEVQMREQWSYSGTLISLTHVPGSIFMVLVKGWRDLKFIKKGKKSLENPACQIVVVRREGVSDYGCRYGVV